MAAGWIGVWLRQLECESSSQLRCSSLESNIHKRLSFKKASHHSIPGLEQINGEDQTTEYCPQEQERSHVLPQIGMASSPRFHTLRPIIYAIPKL